MEEQARTNVQFIDELKQLRRQNAELEALENSQRQVEEELRRSEKNLAEAQRIARMGSWTWDLKTNVFWWSDQMYRLYGLEPGAAELTFDYITSLYRIFQAHIDVTS